MSRTHATAPHRRSLSGRAARAMTVVLAVLVLAGCSAGTPESGGDSVVPESTGGGTERPVVVATNSVLQSIVQLVGGDAFDVRTMIPDGKDPHDHEPSAADIALLEDAELLVQVGLDYEHGVEELVEKKESEGVPVFTLTDHVTVERGDPHVFTDPLTVLEAVDELAAALAQVGSLDSAAAVASATTELNAITATATGRLSALVSTAGCLLVTDHDALEYFARRFGCEVKGVVTPSFSSSAEASAAQVQQLVDGVERSRGSGSAIRAIFVDVGSARAVADKIAELTGIEVAELGVHSLASDGTYGSYITSLAGTIAEALSP